MISSPSLYMLDKFLDENSYPKMAVIDSCYQAINEDLGDQFVIDRACSYTYSMVMEVLERAKDMLIKLCQQVLSYLNNYILNTANLADKYRNLIIDRYGTLQRPIVYKTYTYPKLKDKTYPKPIGSSTELENQIREMQDAIIDKNLSADQAEELVDKLLTKFSRDVIGAPVSMYETRDTARKIVYEHLRGREKIKTLDKDDLDDFITEIKVYKSVKDDIIRTRTETLKYYDTLKRVYTSVMENRLKDQPDLKFLKNPGTEEFKAAEYQRFANINLQMTRLFNGFITIYTEAYNAKLNVIKEKIDANRTVIVEIMTQTGVFAAINTKTPSRDRKPYVFDPFIKT